MRLVLQKIGHCQGSDITQASAALAHMVNTHYSDKVMVMDSERLVMVVIPIITITVRSGHISYIT